MGAIAGRFHRDNQPINPDSLEKMLKPLRPLGSDGGGSWSSFNVAMGMLINHCGSSPNTSLEPYKSSDGIVVVADSQLLNLKELALNLGFDPNQNITETQVILAAYHRWGRHCPDQLTGNFSFAIWDPNHQAMFCARDHVGGRGFCYHTNTHRFLFATEIKGIIAGAAELSHKLNKQYLCEYMVGLRTTYEDTAFESIHRLPPAHALWVSRNNIEKWCYWEPGNLKTQELKLPNHEDGARILLQTILKQRFQLYNKVGISIGGGLNSGILASAAVDAQPPNSKHSIFAITHRLPPDYVGHFKDEYQYAKLIADHLNLDLKSVFETKPSLELGHSLEKKFYALDDPSGNPFSSDYQVIYETAKKSGVELLCMGVDRDVLLSWDAFKHPIGLLLSGNLSDSWAGLRKSESTYLSFVNFIQDIIYPMLPDPLYRNMLLIRNLNRPPVNWEKSQLLRSNLIDDFDLMQRRDYFARYFKRHRIPSNPNVLRWGQLKQVLNVQHRHTAHEHLYGIQTCWPFLDKRLIEFCFQLPLKAYTHGKRRRGLARNLGKGKFPDAIRNRTDRTPFPADIKLRHSSAFPQIYREIKQIENNDPIWEFADRNVVFTKIESLKDLENTSKNMPSLEIITFVRMIVLRSFIVWHQKGPYHS